MRVTIGRPTDGKVKIKKLKSGDLVTKILIGRWKEGPLRIGLLKYPSDEHITFYTRKAEFGEGTHALTVEDEITHIAICVEGYYRVDIPEGEVEDRKSCVWIKFKLEKEVPPPEEIAKKE